MIILQNSTFINLSFLMYLYIDKIFRISEKFCYVFITYKFIDQNLDRINYEKIRTNLDYYSYSIERII